ncbi:MAG: hypothetical protein E7203_05895 [Selenomonas ruminantium]|jgi:hypothetical protein|uniref:Condensation domain-containing protein n=1 Tax=Selenomonas ruminantium TaxID=971 RepID=A0A927WIB8_SELRU|nr:condensation domain-containing protein [Selenomonas ruminantium]MBE6084991.1 hypothetical protein [Selenomonas ruminantium]
MEYKMEKYSVTDLPLNEQNVLEQLYGGQMAENQGYSPNHILYVRELTPAEKGLFMNCTAFQPVGVMVQNLYKIRGKLLPPHFNRALHKMVEECDAMRMNYCSVGKRILAVVFQERRSIASVVYRSLEGMDEDELDATLRRIMDADLRQGIDVRYGCLMRFSIFHTQNDEYAVLVTAVQAVLTEFDVRELFARAMGLKWEGSGQKAAPAMVQMDSLAAPVREYWQKMLGNFPQNCRIPQYGKTGVSVPRHRAYLAHLPAPILSDLRRQARDNKRMMMSILHTAWGILLLHENKCQDVGFCLRVPRREKGADGQSRIPSLVPMRLQLENDELTVQELVNKLFQQFLISQPYAALGRSDIESIVGRQKGIFDHFLDFCDFLHESQSFGKALGAVDGELILQNFWDGRDSKLSMAFRQEENQLSISLQYDEGFFNQEKIEILVKDYLQVLQQMLTDWNLPMSAFRERLGSRLQRVVADTAAEKLDSRAVLQDYLSRMSLFKEMDRGLIQRFMEQARLEVYFEGDRLAGPELDGQLVFLGVGRVARSIELGDGWYYTLDIQKEGSWLNETAMLPDRKSELALEVLTERAVILTIPLNKAQTIMEKTPLMARSIIQYVIRQMEKYQRLWIQS